MTIDEDEFFENLSQLVAHYRKDADRSGMTSDTNYLNSLNRKKTRFIAKILYGRCELWTIKLYIFLKKILC